MVGNVFIILVSRFRVFLVTMGQRQKVFRVYFFDKCCVAQYAEDTPGQSRQVVYVPDDNHRDPREAKHQRDLLRDYFSQVGALAGQDDRI